MQIYRACLPRPPGDRTIYSTASVAVLSTSAVQSIDSLVANEAASFRRGDSSADVRAAVLQLASSRYHKSAA